MTPSGPGSGRDPTVALASPINEEREDLAHAHHVVTNPGPVSIL